MRRLGTSEIHQPGTSIQNIWTGYCVRGIENLLILTSLTLRLCMAAMGCVASRPRIYLLHGFWSVRGGPFSLDRFAKMGFGPIVPWISTQSDGEGVYCRPGALNNSTLP